MDINSLRLTDQEFRNLRYSELTIPQTAADAQLRKAVNGIADWLEGLETELFIPAHFGQYLRKVTGITKEG